MSYVTPVHEMSPDNRICMYRSSQPNLSDFDDFEVDSYLISTRRFILFCDTLFHPEDMARIVHDLGQERAGRPFLVMNSHADWDHAWGNSYFTGEQTAPLSGTPIAVLA